MPFITYPQPNGQLAVIIPCGAVEEAPAPVEKKK